MAFNERLADRIREALMELPKVEEISPFSRNDKANVIASFRLEGEIFLSVVIN
jgi:hypothetical protein